MTGPEKEIAFCEAMIAHYEVRRNMLEYQPEAEGSGPRHKKLCHDNPDRWEEDYFYYDKLDPDKIKISSAFEGDFEKLRFMTLKLDTDQYDVPIEVISCRGTDEHSILRTEGGDLEIKAMVYRDKAGIDTLTLRRWDARPGGPVTRETFSLTGEDLNKFMTFLVSAFFVRFQSDGKTAYMLSRLDKILHEMVDADQERAAAHDARMAAYRKRNIDEEW